MAATPMPRYMVRRVPATTFSPGVKTISVRSSSGICCLDDDDEDDDLSPLPDDDGGLSLNLRDRIVVCLGL